MTRKLNVPLIVGALAVGAVLFFVLAATRATSEPATAALGFVFGAVTLFLRPQKKANPDPPGHIPGAGVHGRVGGAADQDSSINSNILERKQELLFAWAKRGQEIDAVSEAKAELLLSEIVARSARWATPVEVDVDDDDEGEATP